MTVMYGFLVTILMDVGPITTSLSNTEHRVRLFKQNRLFESRFDYTYVHIISAVSLFQPKFHCDSFGVVP